VELEALPVNLATALIIDDEADICFLLGNVLKQMKYAVINSNSLKEGKQKLASMRPAVLFLDNQLPDGSGLKEIKSIRKDYPELKIILMSAHDGSAEKKSALQNGADLFLSKPLSQESIEGSIEQLFEK
jgi:DNA-binding NtrC family response regulator